MLQTPTRSVVYADCVRYHVPIIVNGKIYRVKDGTAYLGTITDRGFEYLPSISSALLHRAFVQLPVDQILNYMVLLVSTKKMVDAGRSPQDIRYSFEEKFTETLLEYV